MAKLFTVDQLDTVVDGFAAAVVDAAYEQKANLKALAYKDEIGETELATALKTEINNKISSTDAQSLIDDSVDKAYKPGGSYAFASLPAASETTDGMVYNITDEFTTTSSFIEGANKKYPAGTNVVVVGVGDGGDPETFTYHYDVLSSFIDTTQFADATEFETLKEKVNGFELASNEDITTLVNSLNFDQSASSGD